MGIKYFFKTFAWGYCFMCCSVSFLGTIRVMFRVFLHESVLSMLS